MRWLVVVLVLAVGTAVSSRAIAQETGEEASPPEQVLIADDDLKDLTEVEPKIEMRRMESQGLYSLELREAPIGDFFRLFAHDYDFNILVDKRISGTITASFTGVSLDEALQSIATMYGLKLERSGKVIQVKPDLVTRAIALKYVDAELLVSGKANTSLEEGQGSAGAGAEAEAATIYDLLSKDGKLLLGQQRNLIMVIDYPDNVEKVEAFCMAVDGRMTSKVFKLKNISSKYLATDEKKEKMEYILDIEAGGGAQ